jgi:two-component system, NtrC family, nitrogen regulation response regulator NtrX
MASDILIVDDEDDIREIVSGILSDEGHGTRLARNSDEALGAIEARRPQLILLDIWLQGSRLDGLQLLEIIKQQHPNVPVVMISGHGNIETAVSAIKLGAYDFIEKPFKADRLILIADRALETSRLKREVSDLRVRSGAINRLVGSSAAINNLRRVIERVGPANSRILISGPAGAGKELTARLIHEHSARAEGPFLVINAPTMTPDRMESELFGFEGGPDRVRQVGALEEAHGGTLYLDEVADMPLETQGKIVRVLQEQVFERVGGTNKVEVDVRVVASSNRDLAAEITAGRFREDLFYRLSVVPIKVPALRERRDDIPLLVRYFMTRSAQNAGLGVRELGEDAMAALQAYDWPGNVRQLKNVVDWLLIMAPGEARDPIRADMLPAEIGSIAPTVLKWEKGGEIMSLPLRDAREVFEREYLLAQVTRFGGNISRTAAFIGMERSALHRKLKSLGVLNGERSLREEG